MSFARAGSSPAFGTNHSYEDGWHNWRDFFYRNILPNKPDDMPLASHVRKSVTAFLFSEYDKANSRMG